MPVHTAKKKNINLLNL